MTTPARGRRPGPPSPVRDVVSLDELARAAGVVRGEVDRLVEHGALQPVAGRYVPWPQAVAVGRRLRAARLATPEPTSESLGLTARLAERRLFCDADQATAPRQAAMPAAASAALHGLGALLVMVFTTAGLGGTPMARDVAVAPEPLRLVYLAMPGPGGEAEAAAPGNRPRRRRPNARATGR